MFPLVGKARVRFIGENANTEALQTTIYDVVLKLGNGLPIVYSQNNVKHVYASRWTRQVRKMKSKIILFYSHSLVFRNVC